MEHTEKIKSKCVCMGGDEDMNDVECDLLKGVNLSYTAATTL